MDYFFSEECYDKVIANFSPDVDCYKTAFARLLSLGIILGALIVKVPQIIKILSAGSVQNLSYPATLMELAAVTCTCAYNYGKGFPFSTWGESFFIAVQVIIIFTLMFHYNQNMMYMVAFAPLYGTTVWYLSSSIVTVSVLATLQGAVIPLILSSRLVQIITTFRNGTTGQLSFITAYMNWLGCAARIFTTLQETQDALVLSTYIASFIANSIIMFQFLWYWNIEKKKD